VTAARRASPVRSLPHGAVNAPRKKEKEERFPRQSPIVASAVAFERSVDRAPRSHAAQRDAGVGCYPGVSGSMLSSQYRKYATIVALS